ncbi:MAG TPA: efflux transporter outer membrane subunit [Rhizomicrobium sp.]|jgi:NodT family efflux transporter outer membrane factor (OMF) lipoprotein|nr:efflux transporter outer membrane subunit [Rhizomicrobium sp.]
MRVAFCATALTALLAGCAVGPDYRKPVAPEVADYAAQPVAATAGSANVPDGDPQRFEKGKEITADWWTLFHSKPLDALIAQALANNSDLKAAQAALSAARENVQAQRGVYFPSVSAGFDATRQRQSLALAPVPNTNVFTYSLFTPEVAVSYVPDIFGLNRRTVESLEAQQQGARYQMAATYTTLTSNVVVTAIQEASIATQIQAIRELIAADAKMVDLLKEQQTKGYASGLDLAAQKSQLAQAKTILPPLVKQAEQLHDLMAVLTGRYPSQAPQDYFDLASLHLPEDLPLSLPSRLVEQRPDILQAEANLHAASAEIGIAVANRLPNIELTANAGSTALALNQLFAPGAGFWSIGADLTAPIFEGGTLLHRERAARASYQQTAEQYRSTVLAAFQNVADTLSALKQDAEVLKAAADSDDAAKTTLELTQRQAKDGYASDLALLTAEQAFQQARVNRVQAQAARFADTAALFQALGGGWWQRSELAEANNDR